MLETANEESIRHLTECQPWLRAFVRAILLVPGDADEIRGRLEGDWRGSHA
jgi:hypothetical protein